MLISGNPGREMDLLPPVRKALSGIGADILISDVITIQKQLDTTLLTERLLSGLSARYAVHDRPAGRAIRALSPTEYVVAVRQLTQGIDAGIAALDDALPRELPPRMNPSLLIGVPEDVTVVVEVRR